MGVPYEVIEDGEYGKILMEKFTNKFRKGYIDIKGITMPLRFADMADEILNWEVYNTDLWISSFPKTGKQYQLFNLNCTVLLMQDLIMFT